MIHDSQDDTTRDLRKKKEKKNLIKENLIPFLLLARHFNDTQPAGESGEQALRTGSGRHRVGHRMGHNVPSQRRATRCSELRGPTRCSELRCAAHVHAIMHAHCKNHTMESHRPRSLRATEDQKASAGGRYNIMCGYVWVRGCDEAERPLLHGLASRPRWTLFRAYGNI